MIEHVLAMKMISEHYPSVDTHK